MDNKNGHYAIIYQMTQECPLKCPMCLRFYTPGERVLSQEQRYRLVDRLKYLDVRSISVTGGEPLILGNKLFAFLKYLHERQIHTALATTGFRLTEEQVHEMDMYLDRLLLSIHSFDIQDWIEDFGNVKYAEELYYTTFNILQWIKGTGITIEVTSVLHQQNKDRIFKLGKRLLELNPNIVWRIDEYYPIGLGASNHVQFDLIEGEFDKMCSEVKRDFSHKFRDIRFSSWKNRRESPGLLITQAGDIMDSAGQPTGFNILEDAFPPEFQMSRPWSEYRKVVRDWGWGDM